MKQPLLRGDHSIQSIVPNSFTTFAPLTCAVFCLAVALFTCRSRGEDVALCFGGGGVVEAPAPKLPADGKALCVEFRFKAYAPMTQAMRAVSQWTDDLKAADSALFHFDLAPGDRLAFTLRVGKGRSITVTGKEPWEPQRWHHAAVTWNGTVLTLYVDGKPAGDRHLDGVTLAASPLPLTVGQLPPKPALDAGPLKGFISDVAVWSAAPDAAVIAQHAAKGIADGEQGLVAHLALRQPASGETTPDSVSGENAKLSTGLARTGWCATPAWDEAAPSAPGVASLQLFTYDLSSPARAASGGDAAPAVPAAPALSHPQRMILLHNARSQQLGVLWQDKGDGGIYLTWIDADFSGHQTVRLTSMEDGILAAGCTDPSGNLCYIEIQKTPDNRDPKVPLKAFLHGASNDGKPLGEVPLDVTPAGKGLNVWNYGGRWGGSMAYQNGSFALILPRTMYQSPDGLNHQGAIAVVFPGSDPGNYKNFGQITGHSFGNLLTTNSNGDFLGLDLGDCYPRGVHLHKFTPAAKVSRVVFTYKTEHATSPRNKSPSYDEISSGGKTFYKWSNDNNTYTELGGVIEGRVSYSVVFSTDRSTAGRVLDNSRAFDGCDDPRDLAMVRVIKDFERAPDSNEVSDAILADGMPEGSASETGGFYNFAGNWTKQRETGVIWLTHHKPHESAHAPHPVRQHDGNALILWEKTSPDGDALCATRVAEDGKVLGQASLPGSTLHLNPEDPVIPAGGRDFLLATDKSGAVLLCFAYEDFPVGSPAASAVSPGRASLGK